MIISITASKTCIQQSLKTAVIARVGNAGPDGWEDLVAFILAIFGSFVGAVGGAVVGALLGWRADRRRTG